MKLQCLKLISFAVLLSGGTGFAHSQGEWKIESMSLTPDTAPEHRLPADTVPNRLTVTVSNAASDMHFELSSDVRLTAVKDSFIAGNKLVALGEAGRASSVVIFDVLQRKEIDWFFCIEPRRVSDNWIVYIEWYPRFVHPKEVVLLYDLDKSPLANRLPGISDASIPALLAAGVSAVGIPIFPASNVRQRSYINVVENPADSETVMAYLSFLLLPRDRLVFVAAQGQDFLRSRDYVVVVGLSNGVDAPVIDTVDVPRDQLKKPGENPNFVKVTGMEQASETAVRLFVPQSEYGVSSIVVNLPAS